MAAEDFPIKMLVANAGQRWFDYIWDIGEWVEHIQVSPGYWRNKAGEPIELPEANGDLYLRLERVMIDAGYRIETAGDTSQVSVTVRAPFPDRTIVGQGIDKDDHVVAMLRAASEVPRP